jgi:hypothetical protein
MSTTPSDSLAGTLERIQQSIEKHRAERKYQLPIWPDPVRGVPNEFIRSALFAAIQAQGRDYLDNTEIACQDGYKIIYTGQRLDQSHLDVFEGVMHIARGVHEGNHVCFSAHRLLRLIGRHTGKSDHAWLHRTLKQLYAFVVCPAGSRQETELALAATKVKFGGTPTSEIHCRTFFAGDQRRKTDWRHLEGDRLFALCAQIGRYVSEAGATFRVAYLDRRNLLDAVNIPSVSRATGSRITAGPKQLTRFVYLAALTGFEKNPGTGRLKVFVDPDNTKMEWGTVRRKPHSINMRIDHGGQSLPVVPETIRGSKPPLLEVADVLAYSAAQTLSARAHRNKDKFRALLYGVFRPVMTEFVFHEQCLRTGQAQ